MNKKIKFIEIFQKYVNGEQMPKTIKRGSSVLDYDNKDKKYYERGSEKCIYLSIENFKELENEFEILEDNTEDNTEEIEELEVDEKGFIHTNIGAWQGRKLDLAFVDKINELVKVINKLRKEKENEQ